MRISELAQRSAVAVPTIKYYLREDMLPAGEYAGATSASYGEHHVERLRLIRALVDVAGMSLGRIRDVLSAVDDSDIDLHTALGAAHEQISPQPQSPPSAESRTRVRTLIEQRGWQIRADGRHAQALAAALDASDHAGLPIPPDTLVTYADAAARVAGVDLDGMPAGGEDVSATYAVTGTVLAEPVLLALRRMAHADISARRFGPADQQPAASSGHNGPVTDTRNEQD